MSILHIGDKRVDQMMGLPFDINKFEIEASARVRQGGEVLAKHDTLSSMQLLVPLSFNYQNCILLLSFHQQNSLSLLYIINPFFGLLCL